MNYEQRVRNIYPSAVLFEDQTHYEAQQLKQREFIILDYTGGDGPLVSIAAKFSDYCKYRELGYWSENSEAAWQAAREFCGKRMMRRLIT